MSESVENNNSVSNPLEKQLRVELSLPNQFKIDMVDASSIRELERWSIIMSVLTNFAVGFLVAAITNTEKGRTTILYVIAGIFIVLFLYALRMVIKYHKQINTDKQTIPFVPATNIGNAANDKR